MSAAFGAWLQGVGCKKGARVALMMPNILQYPVCLFGTLRAGCTVVNVNPLYTPRELEHQLKRFGRRGARVRRELRPHRGRGRRQDARCAQVVVTSIGELLGFKGIARRLRAAPREEDGPEVRAAGIDPAVRRARRRTQAHARARRHRARRHRVPAVHRRHDGRRQGRDAARTATSSPTCCRRARGSSRSSIRTARSDHHAAAALSHLLADGELPRVHVARRRERADPESARHRGLRQGNGQVQVHRVHRRQHAVQRAGQQRRFRQARLLVAAASRSAAAWRCRRPSR